MGEETNSKHRLAPAWKVFKSPYTNELERLVNDFSANHQVLDVKFDFQQISQKGTMICDRIDPNANEYILNIAAVKYVRDITMEMVERGLDKFLEGMVRAAFNGGNTRLSTADPMTGECLDIYDAQRNYVEKLMASDDYKTLEKELEEKYSIREDKDEGT